MTDKQKKDNPEEFLTRTNYKELMKALGTFMSNVTGENVPVKYNDKAFRQFKTVVTEAVKFAKAQEELKQKTFPLEFKKEQEKQILDGLLKTFGLGGIDEFVKNMVENQNPALFYGRYISDPTYIRQKRESLHMIIFELERTGNLEKVSQFNDTMGESAFGLAQTALKLNKDLKYLLRERKRVSKTTIENFLNAYKDAIAAFFESMITYLYGIQKISKGSFETYQNLCKIRIADQVKELKNDPLFNTFVSFYNPNIRNSVVHGGCYIQPSTNEICFTYKKIKPISYSDFVKHVQECVRNAIFIFNLTHEINYLRFYTAHKNLNNPQ